MPVSLTALTLKGLRKHTAGPEYEYSGLGRRSAHPRDVGALKFLILVPVAEIRSLKKHKSWFFHPKVPR